MFPKLEKDKTYRCILITPTFKSIRKLTYLLKSLRKYLSLAQECLCP